MRQSRLTEMTAVAISPEERAFFKQLGARIAELRKAQGVTQVQMAEALSVSQQTINSYEVARRRIPVSALPILAKLFSVSVDDLLGESAAKKKRGPKSKLQQQIEQVTQLPRTKQRFVSDMLDTVLQQASR